MAEPISHDDSLLYVHVLGISEAPASSDCNVLDITKISEYFPHDLTKHSYGPLCQRRDCLML